MPVTGSNNSITYQFQILQMKNDMAKRMDRAKMQNMKYREMPDIVVKVVCRYRAELFFKISRKTKFSRLFNAWTERMASSGGKKGDGKSTAGPYGTLNGPVRSDAASTHTANSANSSSSMQFIFTHNGRTLHADQTPEEQGVEDNDEIVAVELMDLTEGPGLDEWVSGLASGFSDANKEPRMRCLDLGAKNSKKTGRMTPLSKYTLETLTAPYTCPFLELGAPWRKYLMACAYLNILVITWCSLPRHRVRERLKEVLRQYELRERHFECVIRSKELEVLLSRARAAEQKQLADGEKIRAEKADEEVSLPFSR